MSVTNRDPHLQFAQVGVKISFTPETIVRGGFLAVWISEHGAEVEALMAPVIEALGVQVPTTT